MGMTKRSEGDSVRLRNPGPDATVAGAIGMVAGYATVCNRGGVPAGEKSAYSVTGQYLAHAKTGATAIAEGDDLELNGDGNLVPLDGGDRIGIALDSVAINSEADIWFRLPPQ